MPTSIRYPLSGNATNDNVEKTCSIPSLTINITKLKLTWAQIEKYKNVTNKIIDNWIDYVEFVDWLIDNLNMPPVASVPTLGPYLPTYSWNKDSQTLPSVSSTCA